MGFGSYDESEQENQEIETDDDGAGVNIHDSDHDGEVTFQTDIPTGDLVDKLDGMKDDEG